MSNNPNPESSQSRRPTFAAIIFSMLPTLFLLLSFIFALLATTSKEWSYNDYQYADNTGAIVTTRIHRSPFINCIVTSPNNTFIEDCTQPLCDPTGDVDYLTLCTLLTFTKKSMTAADVLSGVGLGLSLFVTTAMAFARPEYLHRRRWSHLHRHHNNSLLSYVSTLTFLISLVAAITFFVTQSIATDMLLNHQKPMGNFITNGGGTENQSPWMPAGAQKYLFMTWGFGVLATVSMGVGWSFARFGGDYDVVFGDRSFDDVHQD